ncbi:hypothetical protein HED60_05510 [Planctomycetales bacterium ZRK34]|nr:hypothetical protein HED60_05510 [Planctomycetales bacterium ZRK34]
MGLSEEDERYLNSKGYDWELLPDGAGSCLVIKGFSVDAGRYDRSTVQLMICIPAGYNDSTLDNFYVDPHLRLKSTNQYPHKANKMEQHAGRTWQRFSRHLPKWRPGIDSLQTFMPFVYKELQCKP